jgi:glucosylceramidase
MPKLTRGPRKRGAARLIIHLLSPLVAAAVSFAGDAGDPPPEARARFWLTTEDLSIKLEEAPPLEVRKLDEGPADGAGIYLVDEQHKDQSIVGLGGSLEPSTCFNLSRLSPEDRARTIARIVDPDQGIGMNLMRICIGTPDFTGDPWYSYNDLPPGKTDPELREFSIERDRAYILPVLREALAANPALLFVASPWSPPGWMKTTGSLIGGSLKPEFQASYAEYFARFILAYEAEGIPIHAVTVQNEPGVDRALDPPRWHYPSCRWTAEQERDFIRDHLGPTLRRHRLNTKIWCYDHNFNLKPGPTDPGLDYPRTILRDPQAAAFVAGVAVHGYEGSPRNLQTLRREFPGVPVHFTEGSVFGLAGALRLIDILRHGASSYNAWVLMLDEQGKPNNGPFAASRTMITLDPTTRSVTEHFDYYHYGHFMRFIHRGAHRVELTTKGDSRLASRAVAFLNPDNSLVVVIVNPTETDLTSNLLWRGNLVAPKLPGRSIATLRWQP